MFWLNKTISTALLYCMGVLKYDVSVEQVTTHMSASSVAAAFGMRAR